EGRTDYRVRSKLLRSGKPRAVVRKTLRQTIVQLVVAEATGDRVLATAQSLELKEHGWSAGTGNLPAAYLTGYLAGRRASAHGLKEAILDIGGQRPSPGGRLFAARQGLPDSAVALPHSPAGFAAEDRLRPPCELGHDVHRREKGWVRGPWARARPRGRTLDPKGDRSREVEHDRDQARLRLLGVRLSARPLAAVPRDRPERIRRGDAQARAAGRRPRGGGRRQERPPPRRYHRCLGIHERPHEDHGQLRARHLRGPPSHRRTQGPGRTDRTVEDQ